MKRLFVKLFGILTIAMGLSCAAENADWQPLRTPGFWEKSFGGVVEAHDGCAWYRCFIQIPAEWQGESLTLSLGAIDDCDETFFNGAKVGAGGSFQPYRSASGEVRQYIVAPERVRAGEWNLLSVRVWDGGGAGGISTGPLRLSSAKGVLKLAGTWEFRTGDDLAWAQWPADLDAAGRAKLAQQFAAKAGPDFGQPVDTAPLAGTQPLTLEGDIPSQLVAGVDKFLLRETDLSVEKRARFWHRDFSSPEKYAVSLETNRQRLAHILGVRDARVATPDMQVVAGVDQPPLVGQGANYEIRAVRWGAFGDVHGEGLLLTPTGREPVADVVAIPDAAQTPEQICGLQDGVPVASQYARRLAESGCRVLVPMIIDRNRGPHLGHSRVSARQFLYNSAFELGRHLIGYEVQKVLAAVDWYAKAGGAGKRRIGVIGYGEGGLLALYAGALDQRIGAVSVSGYFEDRDHLWEEPIDRNAFGLLEQFGDAELAGMIAPRPLIIEAAKGPELVMTLGDGGAPGRLRTPPLEVVKKEVDRARSLVSELQPAAPIELIVSGNGTGPFGSEPALTAFLNAAAPKTELAVNSPAPKPARPATDTAARQVRQLKEMDQHNQRLLTESPEVRREFMKKLDTSSLDAYAKSAEWYRNYFAEEVVGRFDLPLLPANARTRKSYESEKWVGYEVVLDVFPEVIAYGVLLLPRDLKPDEKRPVVVCQHGLEGRPQHVVTGNSEFYHDFAAKLADRGFITFAPQNLYIFNDRFRTLQRKSNPLKKTLFSTIVPQHQQIVNWLKTLPGADPQRVAFYGLSYGGKSAMRIPPLVPDYVLSICSADFNEWVGKNAATAGTAGRYSYVWGGEYEIFEFDLGSTFNYAEMAALIAPRPFMVERGHFDGVGADETVAWEFAKVNFLYNAGLHIGDRCEMEVFAGPHTINGKGTYDFLHKHLRWPK
ncbi:MAG: dienelactone hydrolase family protein [Chthoniobacter sp.]|nr:dienelactone hydrolase family protein [Chthoniobacter sp.]